MRLTSAFKKMIFLSLPLLFSTLVSAQVMPPPPPSDGDGQPPSDGCPASQSAPFMQNGMCVVETTNYEVDPNDTIVGSRKCTEIMKIEDPNFTFGDPQNMAGCRRIMMDYYAGSGECRYTSVGPQYQDGGLSCPTGYVITVMNRAYHVRNRVQIEPKYQTRFVIRQNTAPIA